VYDKSEITTYLLNQNYQYHKENILHCIFISMVADSVILLFLLYSYKTIESLLLPIKRIKYTKPFKYCLQR